MTCTPEQDPQQGSEAPEDTSTRYHNVRALWSKPRGRISPAVWAEIRDRTLAGRIRASKDLHLAYIVRYQAGEAGLDRILVRANFPLIMRAVKKYRYSPEIDDYFQEGRLGLLEGLAQYDPSMGAAPITWLKNFPAWYLYRAAINTGFVVRRPVNQYAKQNGEQFPRASLRRRYCFNFSELDDHYGWSETMDICFSDSLVDDAPLAEELLSDDQISRGIPDVVELLVRCLDERQKVVARGRFYTGLSLAEIGTIFNLSRERIRQIENEILQKLRHRAARLGADVEQHQDYSSWVSALIWAYLMVGDEVEDDQDDDPQDESV